MASIPFRFKAGGDSSGGMPSALSSHSHRSTTKVSHKPFKSRKATKGALKEIAKGTFSRTDRDEDLNHSAGKIADLSSRKTPYQALMSKFDRRNQARQKQQTKHREHLRDMNVFAGREGAPRIVAVIPLCEHANASAAVRSLSRSINDDTAIPEEGLLRTDIERFKQKIQYVIVKRDLLAALDAGRTADFVVIILSPDQEVDELGELILRSIESQGLSTLLTVVQGLEKIEQAKRRNQVLSSLKSYIIHFHPDQEKIHNLDNQQECANLMRSLARSHQRESGGVRIGVGCLLMKSNGLQLSKGM